MKILLYSRDPGGANALIPVALKLKKSHTIYLYGKDMALDKYRTFKISGKDIMNEVQNISIEDLKKFLEKKDIDLLLTTTSNVDYSEKFLWQAAKELNIPSYAILDQWINYGIRFSKYSSQNLKAYIQNKNLIYLPDKIFVMDEFAKKEAIKDGVESSRLIVTGQPFFELLKKRKTKVFSKNKFLKKVGINPKDFVITFASEPLSTIYKGRLNPLGFDEKKILLKIIQALNVLILKNNDLQGITLIIRPHPKDDPEVFKKIMTAKSKINLVLNNTSNGWDIISASDLICGMGSMLLLESVLLDKPILSVQIGLTGEDPFILSRRKIVKSILNENELLHQLESAVVKKRPQLYNFEIISNPVDNIIKYLEKFYV